MKSVKGAGMRPTHAPSTPVGGSQLQHFCADEHSKLRKKHGASPVYLDAELAGHAQLQAETCLKQKTIFHGNNDGEGQNVWMMSYSPELHPSPEKAVASALASWYAERDDYKAAMNVVSGVMSAGHFTQMVWKETTSIGLGVAQNDTMTFVVVNYSPQGNIVSEDLIRKNVQA
ncbi:Pathogenesis-related leaf protein 4 [Diplonema papillatum]|nr:Pathogenesis-related leaf protein 4 [Diplonema papillatum]